VSDDQATQPTKDEAESGNYAGAAILVGLLVLLGVFSLPALVFVLALVFVVFLHELGHYATARWTGMKATEFFLGFGPRIWSFRRGETEFGVKAIWAGAYVKIIGMNNLEEVEPEDESRTYRSKSTRSQVLVASAGSFMHFVVAFLLLATMFLAYGRPTVDEDRWSLGSVVAGTAADEAGIEVGDRPVEIAGEQIDEWADLQEVVSARPNETVDIIVLRDGERVTTVATLGETTLEDGTVQGRLGVSFTDVVVDEVSIAEVVPTAATEFVDLGVQSVTGVAQFFTPSNLADFAGRVFSAPGADDPTDNPESRPVSVVGVVDIGADVASDNIWNAIYLFALFNIFIGIFNLAPLPPLDGGHIAVALYERIRTRKGEPRYQIDYERLLPVAYGVFMVLVFFGLGALWLDLANPLN
jgi:membrane-associated protease RseP (regulator of RpoE activity)